jgi:hypothetical protein
LRHPQREQGAEHRVESPHRGFFERNGLNEGAPRHRRPRAAPITPKGNPKTRTTARIQMASGRFSPME